MELFRRKIGPVFVKESSDVSEYISKLEALKAQATDSLKQEIEKQIKYAKYGEAGEKNIAFELKNSGMDMMILHDLYLEADDLTAQIDYLVITRKIIFVIECKNLYGNIKIDNRGAFIRMLESGGEKGMYSPITQNERHLQMIKRIRSESKNRLQRAVFEKNFSNVYKSIVVLANPQTVLYDRYAPREIKEQVIRYDQLITFIKKANEESRVSPISADEMKETADFFLNKSVSNKSDYAQKYQKLVEAAYQEGNHQERKSDDLNRKDNVQRVESNLHKENLILVQKLKEYRLQKSRESHIKPYYIFNDAQMNDLLAKMPRTADELMSVSGFGPAKVEKYGEDIIKILSAAANNA